MEPLFLTATDGTKVSIIISSLNQGKSDGPNSIPTTTLKLSNKEISDQLAILFNEYFFLWNICFSFENRWNLSNIQKKSKLDCSSYRPIYLLSNIDKLLKRLTHNKLYNFLNRKSYFHSSLVYERNVLIHLTDKITYEIDKGNYVCRISVDISKTYDAADHHVLLKKLEYYSVREISNKWFPSYLNNRKKFISINCYKSNLVDIKCGAPQGSIQGPLLFYIYINDRQVTITYSEVRYFVNNTNFLSFTSYVKPIDKQVNYELKSLTNWIKASKTFSKC